MDPTAYRFDPSGYAFQGPQAVNAQDYRFDSSQYGYTPTQALDPNQYRFQGEQALDPSQYRYPRTHAPTTRHAWPVRLQAADPHR